MWSLRCVLSMSFYSDVLISGDLLTLERLSIPGLHFTCKCAFRMKTNQSKSHTPPPPQPPPLHSFYSPGYYLPVLIPTEPGTRQLGTAPMSLSPLKLFKRANSKPAYSASLIPSHGNHNKALALIFLSLLLPLECCCCFFMWPRMVWQALFSWELSI